MFTDKMIRGLKHPSTGQYDRFESGKIKAFGIRVGKRTKTFFVGVRINGKYRRISLGQYDEDGLVGLSLKQARDRAYDVVKDAQAGITPETKQRRDSRGTFGAVCEAYMIDHAHSLRSRYEMQRYINKDLAVWHARQMREITRGDIKELIRVKARTAPIAANRLMSLVSRIFNWALKEELIDSSPAMRLDRPGKEVERDRNLTSDEIRIVWNGFDRLGYPFGHLFKLLLVTGQRRGEVAGMKWSEISEDGWKLPNERSKNGKGHLIPLTGLAREIIATCPQIADHVFISRQNKPVSAFGDAQKRIKGDLEPWVLHDLRRTAATQWRTLGIDKLVVSKLLNHTEGGVTRIYDRYAADPEKSAAMERWANRLREIISGAPVDKVVQMRAPRVK
jgi:integrase